MTSFGWVAGTRDPPWQRDLRRLGWTLCRSCERCRAECRHVLIVDARELGSAGRQGLTEADRPAWRLLLLGVEEAAERAALLKLGCVQLIVTDPRGGYRLVDDGRFMPPGPVGEEGALDAYPREQAPWPAEAALEDG